MTGLEDTMSEGTRNPDVTVIVAVYNCEPFVRECLESLKAQTLRDFECIVVDDASTDGSVQAARACIGDDERFQLIELAEHFFG